MADWLTVISNATTSIPRLGSASVSDYKRAQRAAGSSPTAPIRRTALAAHPPLRRPPRRHRRIDELKIDRRLAENANDGRRRRAFLHAVVVRRARDARTPGCPVAPHREGHRGPGWRLAPARRADLRSVERDRGCCGQGCRLRAADERAGARADHLERHGGREWQWRRIYCWTGAQQADSDGVPIAPALS